MIEAAEATPRRDAGAILVMAAVGVAVHLLANPFGGRAGRHGD